MQLGPDVEAIISIGLPGRTQQISHLQQYWFVRRKILRVFIFISFVILWADSFAQIDYYEHKSSYKPDTSKLYFPILRSEQDSAAKANSLDTFINIWYSKMLSSMKEPILINYEGDGEIYRFTWLRSFHRPMAIRIQKIKDTINLIRKVLSGAGGYGPGRVLIDTTIVINKESWNEIQTQLEQIKFWEMPAKDSNRGFDGSEWILEGSKKHHYHFISRWSPKSGDYRKLCTYFLALSGIKVRNRDRY